MPPETPTPQELVRILLEREPVQEHASDPAAAAVHAACDDLYRELCRWIGTTGCRALFTRALLSARSQHPALAGIQVSTDTQPRLDGIAEAIETAGAGPAVAGLEGVLVVLIELLGRFIGYDMVANLVERSVPERDAGGSDARRRETSP